MNAPPKQFYEFGPFRTDMVKRLLLRDGEPVALNGNCNGADFSRSQRTFLDKDELMRLVWPDTSVEQSNTAVYIFLGATTDVPVYGSN
jgi:hypothetical protein